jgi:hypothetical protein
MVTLKNGKRPLQDSISKIETESEIVSILVYTMLLSRSGQLRDTNNRLHPTNRLRKSKRNSTGQMID